RSLALQYRKDLMVTEGSAVEESDGDESTMTSGSRTSVAVLAECGMRCSCSVRRCKNRAVSKGVQWRLHVFIPRELVPSTAGLSNGEVSLVYGVKTRENIAIGNFVCEMTGQYIFEEELKARLAESTRGTEGKAEGDDDCKAMMLSPLDNRRVISVWRWAEDCYRPEGEEACRMSALHWNECQLSANRDDTDSASSGSLATASAANGGESAHGNLY
ncbi:set-23, partial [Symbiodinium microadriaticum]